MSIGYDMKDTPSVTEQLVQMALKNVIKTQVDHGANNTLVIQIWIWGSMQTLVFFSLADPVSILKEEISTELPSSGDFLLGNAAPSCALRRTQ